MKEYPIDYNGPKAGISSNEEWQSVTEYQAFKYVRFEVWSYADFDCWLGTRDNWHYNKGSEDAINAVKEFQKKYNVKAEVKSWYNKG